MYGIYGSTFTINIPQFCSHQSTIRLEHLGLRAPLSSGSSVAMFDDRIE